MLKRFLVKTVVSAALVSIFFFGMYSTVTAESAADFYKGKVVRFLVPYSPGGGYDTYSRLIAAAMEKYMGSTVVVINKPGAGGMVGTNHVYNGARRDGLTVAIAPEGIPLAQAMKAPGVHFDAGAFNWLGSVYRDARLVAVSVDSPYKSIEDLRKLKQPKASTTEVTGPEGQHLVIAIEALGMDHAKVVPGYVGSGSAILAVKRGEVDFCAFSLIHFLRDKKLLRPLAVISEERIPQFPEIKAITEFGITPEARKMLGIVNLGKAAGRGLITPPGVSKDKVAYLRGIMMKCLKDPDLLKKAEKLGLIVDPIPGAEVQAGVEKSLAISPEDVRKVKYIILEKYLK